jgi:hypothetical protein
VAGQRIKGQEVELSVTIDGQTRESLADVRSFEFAPMLEIKREGYLGETTDRRDEVYNGVRGRMTLHFESDDVLEDLRIIVDRAMRRDPNVRVNIKATLNFPNGEKPRVVFQNVCFGEMPISFGSRTDYGELSLEFEADDYKVIT